MSAKYIVMFLATTQGFVPAVQPCCKPPIHVIEKNLCEKVRQS